MGSKYQISVFGRVRIHEKNKVKKVKKKSKKKTRRGRKRRRRLSGKERMYAER